jgi:hypothetical protein
MANDAKIWYWPIDFLKNALQLAEHCDIYSIIEGLMQEIKCEI